MTTVNIHVRMGSEHYALRVEDVREVAELGDITPLPGARRPVLGVRNLRGEVMPVIDLAQMLGAHDAGPPAQLVVAQAGTLRAGLAVEAIVGVLDLPDSDTPTDSPGLEGAVLVDGSLIGIVDIAGALATLAGADTA